MYAVTLNEPDGKKYFGAHRRVRIDLGEGGQVAIFFYNSDDPAAMQTEWYISREKNGAALDIEVRKIV